ncbi:glutamine ABC transporter permease [Yersinia enterocolitica]|nr:glutamine ABC transporter permease [Yersinia enterocolitica]
MQFEWSAIWPAIPILLEGAKLTNPMDFGPGVAWRPDYWGYSRFCPRLWRLAEQKYRISVY